MSVDREVVTSFTVDDKQSGRLTSMSGAARSVGTSFASAAAETVSAAFSMAHSVGSAIISIGSRAEDTRLVLGGMFTAFGYAADITQGSQLAVSAIERIEAAAAALPGEAEEYVTVFTAAFANIESHARQFLPVAAGEDSMAVMTDFSNRMTAIGRTFGIDAAQIGRDFNLMLSGRAGAAARTFSMLTPYLRQVAGAEDLTARAFNRMTDAERMRILTGGMAKLQPMLDAAATTWSAQAGTLKSLGERIFRVGTAPIFERARGALSDINNLLTLNRDRITNIATAISEGLVGGFNNGYKALLRFGQSDVFRRLTFFANTMGGMALRIVSSEQGRGGAATAAGFAAGGPLGALVVSTVMSIASNGKLLNDTINGVMTVFTQAGAFIESFATPLGNASAMVGGFVGNMIPGLLEAIGGVISIFRVAFTPLFAIGSDIITFITPQMLRLGGAVGDFANALVGFVLPFVTQFGNAIQGIWQTISVVVRPLVLGFISMLTRFIEGITTILRALRIQVDPIQTQRAPATAVTDFFRTLMTRTTAATTPTTPRTPNTPAARGGHTTNNDFRNSRFTLEQKFAEGFDPDRIAVVFARDIANSVNHRLYSGFDPLFSLP